MFEDTGIGCETLLCYFELWRYCYAFTNEYISLVFEVQTHTSRTHKHEHTSRTTPEGMSATVHEHYKYVLLHTKTLHSNLQNG